MAIERRSIVYEPLTRAKTIHGIPREYLVMVGVASPASMYLTNIIGGLFTDKVPGFLPLLMMFVSFAVLILIGMIAKRWDEDFAAVWLTKFWKLGRTRSPNRYTGNRYHA